MKDWKDYTLEQLGEFKNGVNFSSDKMGQGIALVNVKDITDSPLLHPERMALVDLDLNSKSGESYFAKVGDIFFVRSSVKRDGVGAVGMLKNNSIPVIHCGFVIRFRAISKDVFPRFLFYLLSNPFYREKVRGLSGGATIVNISQESLKTLKVSLPSMSSQQRIASILSSYDELIENNLKRIGLLEELAKRTYEEWFVRFRIKGAQLGIDTITGLPKGWERKTIGDMIQVGRGSSPRPIADKRYFDGGTIPWLKIADATASYIFIHETKEHVNEYGASFSRKLRPGSLIVAASGTLGFPMFLSVEACIHDGWIYFDGIGEELKEYFYYSFIGLRKYFESISYGAAIQNINTGIVKSATFILPPKEILKDFKKIAGPILESIELIQKENILLEEAKDILIPRLMNGEIDVEKSQETLAIAAEPFEVYKSKSNTR